MKNKKPIGKIRRLKLSSDNTCCIGPILNENDIVRQKLVIHDDGRVSIKYYTFGSKLGDRPRKPIIQRKFRISSDVADYLLSSIRVYLNSKDCEISMATDTGMWNLKLLDDTGRRAEFFGALIEGMELDGQSISTRFRKYLGIDDLFVFYGGGRKPVKVDDGKYIFVDVLFEDGGKTYCYISDAPDISEGDEVLVPVGEDGRTAVAHVVYIDVKTAEEAPFPVDLCKHIINVIRK